MLAYLQDRRWFITDGIQHGFCIGFDLTVPKRFSKRNIQSGNVHAEVVQEYLDNKMLLQHVYELGEEEAETLQGLQLNPFGIILKRGRPGKWCIIINLSSPDGQSIKDGISTDLYALYLMPP